MRGRAPDLLAREVSRRRVLCLHGFRASGDMLALSLGPLTRALGGTYDFTFVDAPTAASGPAEPGVPEGLLGYECFPVGAYDTAWRPAYEHGFDGAAMALLVPGARDARPSLHVYDAAEPHAHLCRRVEASFEGPAVVRHGEGHAVPRAEAATREMVRFVERV
ncbi:hypothetical protein EMIHUDRAFT_238530 [Emiliania huxleyi CCMP1516]|uniref:Serine hydrolase domain-containing protein n=2 Tax=Emiliania huxleyi TaxID=2903 RepID=A0A0D3JLL4_EMIH1|nr:hypothetical protein EMIHUDRAFT_238530 [Emiliania huxleyi CCMP1516]EOD24399.1 hypothetical protein EMIHUDRAFT_238530 [Emiliania huxleyi CCMP1516]|eukprot:XP_005776828.1 hypothetical protein EMIHUDRAFT_238530 [Emiliania huxleyi CCMP1516]